MPYLVAAIVIVGMISSLNLLLTYGVIRRLREHTRRLAERPGALGSEHVMLDVGAEPAEFVAATTAGERLTRRSLAVDGTMVGFFTPACAPCREQMSLFIARAAETGADRALAVVIGSDGPARRGVVALFEPVARVVVEPDQGQLQQAFGVHGYPAICLLDGQGRIRAAGAAIDRLSERQPPQPVA